MYEMHVFKYKKWQKLEIYIFRIKMNVVYIQIEIQ